MPDSGLDWKPPEAREDVEQMKQRAERFGTEFKAPDETGLMEVGERLPGCVWVAAVPILFHFRPLAAMNPPISLLS